MEPEKFDFWQSHSPQYLEMAFRHDRCERIEHPEGYGKRTGQCRDTEVGALYLALTDYQEKKRQSWKKLYSEN